VAVECVVVRVGDSKGGATGLDYLVGISAETAGARRLCLQLVGIPPGGRASAHLHREHESALYVLEGEVVMWYGERLERHAVTRAGDFLFVPAGVAHLPANYGSVAARAVLARSDPNAQESVVALPELDALPHLARPPA
jgi:uncharacterized RmlC-like cupin family protein